MEPELDSSTKYQLEDSARSLTITFGTIALAAKLSAADGTINDEEIRAFCDLFSMPVDELPKIRNLMARAAADPNPVEHYARKVARLLGPAMQLRRDLLKKLCTLAEIDGKVTLSEQRVLHAVAGALVLDEDDVHSYLATSFAAQRAKDPYALLRVARKATLAEIKQAYRNRLRELHPDLLETKIMAAEDAENARNELLAVQSAYNQITAKRKN